MLDKTASRATYRGGEGQTVFPIPFPFLENNHLSALRRGADGSARALLPGADYAVNRVSDGNGELILLGDPLPEGSTLEIGRRVPLTQEILFHNQGPNSPRAMEEALDKLTMIAQELRDDLDGGGDGDGGASSDELEALRQELRSLGANLDSRLAGKAALTHNHEPASVSGLQSALAAKADLPHKHQEADVNGLAASLESARSLANSHASRHAKGGGDPITPASLGVLPAPPSDGKRYLAASGGWVEYVAPAGPPGGGEGGTLDHAQLLNRDAADQHPQSAIQHLPGDLAAMREQLSSLDQAVQSAAAGLSGKADKTALPGPATAQSAGLMSAADKQKLDLAPADVGSLVGAVDARVDTLSGRVDGLTGQLGPLAAAADAPANGKPHVRQNGAWQELAASGGGSGGGAIAGEIRLLPFRAGELPAGWYFCNGDRYGLATSQGSALAALPATMRSDWGIAATGPEISLPNLFSGAAGHFLRPVDNSSRLPGSRQDDAIRNVTGTFGVTNSVGLMQVNNSTATGAFKIGPGAKNYGTTSLNIGSNLTCDLRFDASGAVATAEENRPLNIGMTPAIYLGV